MTTAAEKIKELLATVGDPHLAEELRRNIWVYGADREAQGRRRMKECARVVFDGDYGVTELGGSVR